MTTDTIESGQVETTKCEMNKETVEIDLQEKEAEVDSEEKKCQDDLQEKEVEIDLQEKAANEIDATEDEPLVKKDKEPVTKKTVHKQDYEEGTVYLYQTNRSPLLPSIDPACLKLETWLRLTNVKYENVDHGLKFKSKKGLLPFVELDGEEYSDALSLLKVLNADLDGSLTVQQKNLTSLVIAMLENHFSWILKSWRSENSEKMLKAYKMDLQSVTGKTWPSVILSFVHKRQIKKLAHAVVAHGIGIHTPEEIENFGKEDLQVLSDLLGEQDYFFGDSPSSLDVVAFAHIAQLVYMDSEVKYGLREWLMEKCTNLVALCDRLKAKAFPDWEILLAAKMDKSGSKESDKQSKKEQKTKGKKDKQVSNEEKEDKQVSNEKEDKETENEEKKENKDADQTHSVEILEKEADKKKVEKNGESKDDIIQEEQKEENPSNEEEKKDEEKKVEDKKSDDSTEL